MKCSHAIALILLAAVFLAPSIVAAQAPALNTVSKEDQLIQSSMAVLDEVMRIPADAIPESLLSNARGLVIIPKMIKGSFVIGGRHGRGVLMIRDDQSRWHAPVFISVTGASVGFQAGIQSTDLILVFKTQKSVQGILSGKFTIGADAAFAAGPVGRQAVAATDVQLKAEIYSYSRNRGLSAGVSIDGAKLQPDMTADATYYSQKAPDGSVFVPPAAMQLIERVGTYCGAGPALPVAAVAQPQVAQPYVQTEADLVRDRLSRNAGPLFALLDQQWRAYLALPPEVTAGQGHPSTQAIQKCADHFDRVTTAPQYAPLAARAEFQLIYNDLRHYVSVLSEEGGKLQLPAPPTDDAPAIPAP